MMRKSIKGGAMPLMGHLDELRSRLIVSVVAVLVCAALAFLVTDQIIALLKIPAGSIDLHVFSPVDGFMVRWRVALFTALILAAPIWVFELISFLAPGLTAEERKLVIPLVIAGFGLMALGVGFGYYLLFGMMRVLIQLFGTQLTYFPSADAYISFVSFFMLSTGLAFELPVVLYALVRLRIISSTLLRKQRKFFYFGMFVFAEIITPVADPIVAPLTILIPMVILYEITVGLARLAERNRGTAKLNTPTDTTLLGGSSG